MKTSLKSLDRVLATVFAKIVAAQAARFPMPYQSYK